MVGLTPRIALDNFSLKLAWKIVLECGPLCENGYVRRRTCSLGDLFEEEEQMAVVRLNLLRMNTCKWFLWEIKNVRDRNQILSPILT